MKPRVIHRLCAHPVAISWALIASGANALVIAGLANELTWPVLRSGTGMVSWLLLLCTLVGLLCFFPAAIVSGPVARICRWCNGSPLQPGDQVCVLVGAHRGRMTSVYEMSLGQGGQPVARVDLGSDHKRSYRDTYDDFALLRTDRRKQAA